MRELKSGIGRVRTQLKIVEYAMEKTDDSENMKVTGDRKLFPL